MIDSPKLGNLITSIPLELIHPDYTNSKINGRYTLVRIVILNDVNKTVNVNYVTAEWLPVESVHIPIKGNNKRVEKKKIRE